MTFKAKPFQRNFYIIFINSIAIPIAQVFKTAQAIID